MAVGGNATRIRHGAAAAQWGTRLARYARPLQIPFCVVLRESSRVPFAGMMRPTRHLLCARYTVAALGGLLAFAPASRAQGGLAQAMLARNSVRLDSLESDAVDRGEAIVRVLPTQDQKDVAVLGVIRIGLSRDLYLRRVQDFRAWLRAPTRTRLGLFSDPASPTDVEEVVITRQDANDLRKCKPGNCTTKLPANAMQRLHDEVDWNASDLQARITAIARERLVEYVNEYRDHGNASLTVYDDRQAVRASDAFVAVLAQSAMLNQTAPALASYLKTFPRGRPGGVSDVLFWSEDVVPRLRPILSVTHGVVYTPPELAGASLIVSKQLYANHFFEAALEVLSVIDVNTDAVARESYLVMERRYRFDNLPRGILNIRGKAVAGLREHLRADLSRERAQTDRGLPAR